MSHYYDYYVPTVIRDASAAISNGCCDHCMNFGEVHEVLASSPIVVGGVDDSYFDTDEEAAEHASKLFWDDGFSNALFESGLTAFDVADKGPRHMDAVARDAALYESEDEIRSAWYARREKLAEDNAMSWREVANAILSWPQEIQNSKARAWIPSDFHGEEFPLVSSITPYADDFATSDPFMSINLMELN